MSDRFQPPEPSVSCSICVNCGAERLADAMLYDERGENYVCDRDCFYEWADDNAEEVADYYYEMNIL